MQHNTRPNFTAGDALIQASMTAKQYANHAIDYAEKYLHDFSEENKTKIICALIQAQVKDLETSLLVDAIWSLGDAIKEHGYITENDR